MPLPQPSSNSPAPGSVVPDSALPPELRGSQSSVVPETNLPPGLRQNTPSAPHNAPPTSQASQGEPSLIGEIAHGAREIGSDIETSGEQAGRAEVQQASDIGKEGFRVASRVVQGLLQLPEGFVDHLTSTSDHLRDQLDAAHLYQKRGEPIPESLKDQIRTSVKVEHAIYYASEALKEWTDKTVSPPQTTIGKFGEGITTFLAGLAIPLPKADVEGMESSEALRFSGPSDAERTLSVLRSKGYRIMPGDMEAHAHTAKTGIGKMLQTIGASRGYAMSVHNAEQATRDINIMFGRDEDLPLGDDDLEEIRAAASAPYEGVRALNTMSPDEIMRVESASLGEDVLAMKNKNFKTPFTKEDYRLVEAMRSDLNHSMYSGKDMDLLLKGFRRAAQDKLTRTASAKDRYLGSLYKQGADILERFLGREADRQQQPGLAQALREARRKIAQTWDVQGALDGGRVSARRLLALRRLRRGKAIDPTLDLIARGYEFAPRSFQPMGRVGQAEGRNYLFSWAAWGLLRGDPRLMLVYLSEHGARKLSESGAFQLSDDDIAAAMDKGAVSGIRAGTKGSNQSIDQLRQRQRRQALREILGLQAEEGSSDHRRTVQ